VLYFLSVLFGLIIGSFLNVIILRYKTGRTLSGRSGCLSCGKKLNWHELFPVFSFLVQGGRCRGCKSKISWQYPLVEILTGLLFLLIFWHSADNWLATIFYWVIASLLIIITVYDFRHQIIPDRFVFTFILLGLLQPLILSDHPVLTNTGWGIVGGIVTALPLFVLWLISRGRWLGFGDVKLALGVGLLLGWQFGLSALVIAFWVGALIGLFLIAWGKTQLWRKGKSYTMKSEVPFAPFLILGFWLVFFLSINVLIF
jgi:leader peptidase (prepilin peptidase)/N-methyltransferase